MHPTEHEAELILKRLGAEDPGVRLLITKLLAEPQSHGAKVVTESEKWPSGERKPENPPVL